MNPTRRAEWRHYMLLSDLSLWLAYLGLALGILGFVLGFLEGPTWLTICYVGGLLGLVSLGVSFLARRMQHRLESSMPGKPVP